MPSNNSKYSEEMREQIARYIIESGKSALTNAILYMLADGTTIQYVKIFPS